MIDDPYPAPEETLKDLRRIRKRLKPLWRWLTRNPKDLKNIHDFEDTKDGPKTWKDTKNRENNNKTKSPVKYISCHGKSGCMNSPGFSINFQTLKNIHDGRPFPPGVNDQDQDFKDAINAILDNLEDGGTLYLLICDLGEGENGDEFLDNWEQRFPGRNGDYTIKIPTQPVMIYPSNTDHIYEKGPGNKKQPYPEDKWKERHIEK